MGETFADIASSGPLLLGVAVAVIAGLVSFFSPCVLPLVPGYLAYVTGLSGADLAAAGPPPARTADHTAAARTADHTPAAPGAARTADHTGTVDHEAGDGEAARAGTLVRDRRTGAGRTQGRIIAGGLLFVAGFGSVFITIGVIAASAGRLLQEHQRALEVGGGILMVVFALALLGLVPGMQREVRIRRLPAAGLAGAPAFGAVFALSWIPCIGPTIGAVLALGAIGGQPARAAVLAAAYSLGIGLPLLAFGLGLRWIVGAVAVIRRHGAWVTRVGAALLLAVGLALLTGAWGELAFWLRVTVGVGEVSI